jgi:hypothetical protein
MHAQDLLVNDGSNWEAVEAVSKSLPQLNIVPSFALVIESINSIDGSALVISSEEEKVLWVLDLVGEEETNSLQALLSSVHIISQEEIVGIRGEPTIFEESE